MTKTWYQKMTHFCHFFGHFWSFLTHFWSFLTHFWSFFSTFLVIFDHFFGHFNRVIFAIFNTSIAHIYERYDEKWQKGGQK